MWYGNPNVAKKKFWRRNVRNSQRDMVQIHIQNFFLNDQAFIFFTTFLQRLHSNSFYQLLNTFLGTLHWFFLPKIQYSLCSRIWKIRRGQNLWRRWLFYQKSSTNLVPGCTADFIVTNLVPCMVLVTLKDFVGCCWKACLVL